MNEKGGDNEWKRILDVGAMFGGSWLISSNILAAIEDIHLQTSHKSVSSVKEVGSAD